VISNADNLVTLLVGVSSGCLALGVAWCLAPVVQVLSPFGCCGLSDGDA
jgi:hypothetical protein